MEEHPLHRIFNELKRIHAERRTEVLTHRRSHAGGFTQEERNIVFRLTTLFQGRTGFHIEKGEVKDRIVFSESPYWDIARLLRSGKVRRLRKGELQELRNLLLYHGIDVGERYKLLSVVLPTEKGEEHHVFVFSDRGIYHFVRDSRSNLWVGVATLDEPTEMRYMARVEAVPREEGIEFRVAQAHPIGEDQRREDIEAFFSSVLQYVKGFFSREYQRFLGGERVMYVEHSQGEGGSLLRAVYVSNPHPERMRNVLDASKKLLESIGA